MENSSLMRAFQLAFLYIDKYTFHRDWNFKEEKVPYSMIRFIVEGEAKFVIDENTYYVSKNDIIYIPEGCNLQCESSSNHFSFISIRFTASYSIHGLKIWSEIMNFDTQINCEDGFIINCFYSMIKEKNDNKSGVSFILRGYLEIIVGYLISLSKEKSESRTCKIQYYNREIDNRVQIIINDMINNPLREFSTEYYCKISDISEASLRRLFKKHTGKSPNKFFMEIKMTVAARRILETDDRISEICNSVGITDANYFSKIFKKYFRVSPHIYRKISRG
ncbi:MAG: AraC family transcriptional regulator [Leptotrichiaceae bacterium]|nr:AraC family transcriptional regulator [Leptotrichiaceae bacterium]